MKKIILSAILALFLAACSFKGTQQRISKALNANEFQIIALENNQSLSFDKFIGILSTFDIVLVGEKHDELAHHIMEERIYKALSAHEKLAVVLEMLSVDKQSKIDAAKEQNVSKNELLSTLAWEKGWNESLYSPLVQSVFYSKDELLAGNISRGKIAEIFKDKLTLKGDKSVALNVREKIKKIIAANHRVDLKDENKSKMLDSFVWVQLFKDRQMAQVLETANTQALLFAGRYHTDKSIGVPLHFRDIGTKKSFTSVMLGVDESDKDFLQADFLVLFKKN